MNDFSIASLGTNINYTDDDFYVFYKRRSQVTVKYWVKWMNHNGQNKEAYIGIQQVVENEHFNPISHGGGTSVDTLQENGFFYQMPMELGAETS